MSAQIESWCRQFDEALRKIANLKPRKGYHYSLMQNPLKELPMQQVNIINPTMPDARFEGGTCSECGVYFFAPLSMINKRRKEGGFIYCPNGHKGEIVKQPDAFEEALRQLEKSRDKNE